MRVRSPEDVADALMDPAEEPDLARIVKRPTAGQYAHWKVKSPGERLWAGFKLMAFARSFKVRSRGSE